MHAVSQPLIGRRKKPSVLLIGQRKSLSPLLIGWQKTKPASYWMAENQACFSLDGGVSYGDG